MAEKSLFESYPAPKLATCAISILFFGLILQIAYDSFCRTFLYAPMGMLVAEGIRFSDFFEWFRVLDDPHFHTHVPPLGILFMGFWKYIGAITSRDTALNWYLGLWLVALIWTMYALLEKGEKSGLKKLCWAYYLVMLSYPVIFCIDRGNMAGFTIAFFGMGVLYYRQEKFLRGMLFIALAVNIKMLPFVFLAIPFIQRRWRLIASCMAMSIAIFVISALLVRFFVVPGYPMDEFFNDLSNYYELCVIQDNGFLWNSSLFTFLKRILHFTQEPFDYRQSVIHAIPLYNIGIGIFTLAIASLLWLKKPPFLHCLIILVCWMLLAPHVSAYYYVGLLLVPLALCIKEEMPKIYVVLICLCMVPKEYTVPFDFSTGTLLFPLTILALLLYCVYDVLKNSPAHVRSPAAGSESAY